MVTTRLAGGLVCSTTPKSIRFPSPSATRYWFSPRARKLPCPALPRYWPSSITTRPRDSVVTTWPVISIPSYAE